MIRSKLIKEVALAAGADACGIAPMSRFNGAPDEMNPQFLFPEAKSCIGFVFRIPRGVQRGIEEGTQFFQYASLQMGLPALYYSGRENPPHPEIWVNYFLRMMELYSNKVYELSKESTDDELDSSLSYLNAREKDLLIFLLSNRMFEFTPVEVSKKLGVTNKTIINRCVKLTSNGFLIPNIVKERIRTYSLSSFSRKNEKQIILKCK